MKFIHAKVKSFLVRKEEGASMAEYGLLIALIAVVCIASVGFIGTNLAARFSTVATAIGGT